ncbi:hypothetical protein K469DRAFT_671425 [Zopfia rhizophila CBS 207.26]|uniref:JmjC domain-containing protein n=1 Tax=Zopfia rhizophila CBS 207.26 TaxID=1314779 RepID=A0A6A6DQH9_9PEZI|nr:hypothetical protein K469DRAFT_671425 [Zopfia rhizophila CBS 207.26]
MQHQTSQEENPDTDLFCCGRSHSKANWARHRKRTHGDHSRSRVSRKGPTYRCACGEELSVRNKARYKKGKHKDCVATNSHHDNAGPAQPSVPPPVRPTTPTDPTTLEEFWRQQCSIHQDASRNAVQRALNLSAALLTKFSSKETRLSLELPEYQSILREAIDGKAITYFEYISTDWEGDAPFNRHQYVVCSEKQAEEILKLDPPRLPLLIPATFSTSSSIANIGIDEYLTYLSTKPTIDVHNYGEDINAREKYIHPTRMSSADAIKLFRDPDTEPVNFLNLAGYRPNPVPACMANLRQYSILRNTMEYDQSGKATEVHPNDLSSCTSFEILGKAGAFHLPHMDHHGVITSVRSEEGDKLWLEWSALQEDEIISWGCTHVLALPSFPVYITDGDIFIQPGGRVHSPFSLTDVHMSGTMHWDSRSMVPVLKQSLLELQYPTITNEEPAKEFNLKLARIGELWNTHNPYYPWADEESRTEFNTFHKDWLAKTQPGCNCTTRCGSRKCNCVKNNVRCGPACHRNTSIDKCRNRRDSGR